MFPKKGRRPYSHLLRLLIVAFVLALASVSALSSTKAYAATAKKQQGKTVGAELIVNGKVFKLTAVSSASISTSARPYAVQYCAGALASESNISRSGTAAYFTYSLRIYNECNNGVAVTRGNWQAQGSINCDGTWYDNPPSDRGSIPYIASGKSILVRDQNPYEAICIGVIFDTIPYTYPPSEIQIVSAASGSLSNGNTWSDVEENYFTP